jgi:hypothetical protein
MFLTLDNPRNRTVVLQDPGGLPVLSTDDAEFDFEAVPMISIGRMLDGVSAFEATYFGLKDWDADAIVVGDNDLRIPGDLGLATLDFFGADEISIDYSAELHSAELNYLYRFAGAPPVAPGASSSDLAWLAGFRYVRFDERFNIHSFDLDSGASDYETETENNLYGAQIGLVGNVNVGRWTFSGRGTWGVFANDASQHQTVGDLDNTIVLRDASADEVNVAFVSQLGATVGYRFTEWFAVKAGYHLLWLNRVARAPDQLDFTNTLASGSSIDAEGDAFLHGASAAVELSW